MVEPENPSDELVPRISSILMTFPHPIISWTTIVTLNVHKMEYTVTVPRAARGMHEERHFAHVVENKMFQL
jgi:hypothetical protein